MDFCSIYSDSVGVGVGDGEGDRECIYRSNNRVGWKASANTGIFFELNRFLITLSCSRFSFLVRCFALPLVSRSVFRMLLSKLTS